MACQSRQRVAPTQVNERELRIIDASVDQLTDLDALTDSTDIDKAFAAQRSLCDLRKRLPALIDIYERRHLDALVTFRLKRLSMVMTELEADAGYLFELPKPGGQEGRWHIQAKMLRVPIEHAWKQVGREQLSNKPDGPLVKVLSCALRAAYGRAVPKHTISTKLNREKRRKKSQ